MGRLVRLEDHDWLDGPAGKTRRIGRNFFDELARDEDMTLEREVPESGLLRFEDLSAPGFDAARVQPLIADFYNRTTAYSLSLWSTWRGPFKPFGWLVSSLFARRLGQLNMPLDPLDSAQGITSCVVQLRERATGRLRYTGWERRFVRSGEVLYCGTYSVATAPRVGRPCVKVVFPLPNGSATVLLRPVLKRDGSLLLQSSGKGFGDAGFYFIVRRDRKMAWAFYLSTMKEQLHVYTDGEGVLRTDHNFKLWGMPFLSLHYRMTPRTD